jgi:hypothetical protein
MRLEILTCAAILIGGVSCAQAADKSAPVDDATCQALWYEGIDEWRHDLERQSGALYCGLHHGRHGQGRDVDANEFKAGCKGGHVRAP